MKGEKCKIVISRMMFCALFILFLNSSNGQDICAFTPEYINTVNCLSGYTYYKDNIHANEVVKDILGKINQEVESWDYWYDKKLFKMYYNTDLSLRKLADETNISVTSIFNSCKNYKEIIRNKFGEDFEDYLNGDFDLIQE